ncbi:trypsin [Pilimelia terevasa]|uniref:Trypsin n=1 Tax=Pilimelia terevasa TaxID=53372 RepID=A0A8J3BQJ0_9ACTN|nr:serine protease [Pilimelia terevasa]GGK42908.1 trypsin [Pilimelia terevasa]
MRNRPAIIAVAVAAAVATPVVAHAGTDAPAPAPAAATTGDPQGIVGGEDAAEGAYPWMAHLTVAFKSGSKGCGATLLSKDIVLTAQQCLAEDKERGKPTGVTADIGQLDHTEAEEAGTRRVGARYLLGGGVGAGDWAVVKLTKSIKAKSFPVLPADEAFDAKKTMRALGWGSTKEGGKPVRNLQEVDLPVVSAKVCGKNADNEICAGDLAEGGVDTCTGDGGGPLLASGAGKTWVQVGITSHGVGCGRKDKPGHYTKVSAFTAKIQAAITLLEGEAAKTTA